MFDPEMSRESELPNARPSTIVPFGPISVQRIRLSSVSESKLSLRASVSVKVSVSVAPGTSIARVTGGTSTGAESRSEEHTSELQSLMRISYAVFCLKKKTHTYEYVIEHNMKYNKTHTTYI